MAAEDVLTIYEAKEAVNVALTSTNLDDVLPPAITNVSQRLDEIIGPVVNRTVTEYHDGGCAVIWPRQTPVSAVTTLKEFDGSATTTLTAETFGTTPSDAYLLEQSGSYSHDHRIIRRSGGCDYWFTSGRRNIELVYVAGRAADTASVPARFKEAAKMILRRAWDREAGAWARATDPFEQGAVTSRFFDAVSYVVDEQLADERRLPGLA